MKKAIILALLLLCIAPVSAQVWVGGELGFSVHHTSNSVADSDMSSTFQQYILSPKVGYDFNDHFGVGLNIGFSYGLVSSENTYKGENYANDYTTRNISIFPFVRYSFAEWNKVRFFVDGGLGYEYQFVGSSSYSPSKRYYAAIYPGISYPINDRIGLIAHLGEISYCRMEVENSAPYNDFSFSLIDQLQVGFFVRL